MGDAISNHVPIVEVNWRGPFTINEIDDSEGKILYQIYGHHPAYGSDSLLYIGISDRGVARIKEHQWISNQCDNCRIYYAKYFTFTNLEDRNIDWKDKNIIKKSVDDLKKIGIGLKQIESLLIYAHHPASNSYDINKLSSSIKKHFRIFNTGRRKALDRELSTQFFEDFPRKPKGKNPEIIDD